jgi:hypothetical protein
MAALRHAAHLSQGHRNTVKHPRRSGARITETKAFARAPKRRLRSLRKLDCVLEVET